MTKLDIKKLSLKTWLQKIANCPHAKGVLQECDMSNYETAIDSLTLKQASAMLKIVAGAYSAAWQDSRNRDKAAKALRQSA